MFNFRIISVCLGHLGGSAGGGIGIGKRRPGMPLTSNLFRSGNPNCIFCGGGACRIVVYIGHILLFLILPAQFGMARFLWWWWQQNVLNSEFWPCMFSVRWACWVPPLLPWPPPGSGSILPSPLQGTLWNLSHLLLRDGAGVCVEHGCVQQQHFGLLWSRVVQFQGMFGFPRIVWIAP